MTYEERSQKILKDAIKSAIYIDENARTFFQKEAELSGEPEEAISEELYRNFAKQGVSLEIFKYTNGIEDNPKEISFILDNRDLVILDWNLKGDSGELESLKILSKIVAAPHIHFCTIYTKEPQLDTVIKNILTYFSNNTSGEFFETKEIIELFDLDKILVDDFHFINLNRDNKESGKRIGEVMKHKRNEVTSMMEQLGTSDKKCAILKASNSLLLSNPHLPDERLPCPSFVDPVKNILVIENTIIAIMKKSDTNAENLLNKFITHIIEDVDNFNQLLGIELYNKLFRTSVITNGTAMSFSKNALVHHRKKLKEEGLNHFFKSLMDEILLEKIALSLRERESILLDDEVLDKFESELPDNYSDDKAFHKMNVFYNSFFLNKVGQHLNFGDVFLVEPNENHKVKPKYLICVTALCDCLNPQEKTKGNYYFAEGQNIKLNTALDLGESAFISYLKNEITIAWTDVADKENQQKYSPNYVKPVQYKVLEAENRIDKNNQIKVYYIDKTGKAQNELLTYLGTIRPNYTQRIANHAFTHPVRVGVDFAKV